jgi:hypothetical protein
MALNDGQMARGDLTLDAHLVAHIFWYTLGAPPLYKVDIGLWRSGSWHVVSFAVDDRSPIPAVQGVRQNSRAPTA